jgi:tetratricopeptide (TPR) repeat protein
MISRLLFLVSSLLVAAAIFFFWASPWSPVIPHRARQKVLQGDVEAAVSMLQWRSENAFSSAVAQESLWEAAQLATLRLDDPTVGIGLLEECLELPDFPYEAQAHSQLAALLSSSDQEEAIRHWTTAIAVEPDHPEAPKWRVRVANGHESLGNIEQAISAWELASVHERFEVPAHLALGRLQLQNDPVDALRHFNAIKDEGSVERARSAELGEQLAKWQIERKKLSGE